MPYDGWINAQEPAPERIVQPPRIAPKVSIMMIAYNQARFIGEAIESALAQDYPNLEIVISDDASTDATPEIILDYAEKNPGKIIPVLNSTNSGITSNSNAGLEACTGEFIAFTDGDDLLLPGKISAQIEWFAERPDHVLCGHLIEIFHDDGSRPATSFPKRLHAGQGAALAIEHILYSKISMMVRASRIPAHGFEPSLKYVSDLLFPIEVLGESGRFGFIDGIYARARRHDSNITDRPFELFAEVSHHFDLIDLRFPQFRSISRKARTRRMFYDVGVTLLRHGRKAEARAKFVETIKREPLFVRAWVRVLQSI